MAPLRQSANRRVLQHADADPRGPWVAEHKGAGKTGKTVKFITNYPPYRWELVEGELPQGLWRVSPYSGVIWGCPTRPGAFRFVVETCDAAGDTARAEFAITVLEDGEPGQCASPSWLLHKKDWDDETEPANEPIDGKPLRVRDQALPRAVAGRPYSACLEAEGGNPYRGTARPGAGRFWEIGYRKLIDMALEDRLSFGQAGKSIPSIKQYPPPDEAETKNVVSWWPGVVKNGSGKSATDDGVGWTEDATRHLKQLVARGLIDQGVMTAKPEALLARLLDVFTRPADLVLEPFGDAADMAAVALKTGRRFLYLSGGVRQSCSSCDRAPCPDWTQLPVAWITILRVYRPRAVFPTRGVAPFATSE